MRASQDSARSAVSKQLQIALAANAVHVVCQKLAQRSIKGRVAFTSLHNKPDVGNDHLAFLALRVEQVFDS